VTTIQLAIPTVHCMACKLNIEEGLEELAGVTGSDVDLDAKQVAVTYDADVVGPDAITATIEDAGYPVG
jgi:periplasmic mercuric ion binding protein